MYADDTSLNYQNHSMHHSNRALNQDLKALDKWLKGNKLFLNLAKVQPMAISTKQKLAVLKSQTEQLNLHVHDKDLDGAQSTWYLGVHIDNTLDWKKTYSRSFKKDFAISWAD